MSVNIMMVALALYAFGAVCFMLETYLEGERAGGSWDRCRICGLIMSMIWPLQICAVAVLAIASTGLKETRRSSAL